VAVALAATSGPDIGSEPLVAVLCTSCRTGAEAPTTTVLPAKKFRGKLPSSTRAKEIDGNVPVGPA